MYERRGAVRLGWWFFRAAGGPERVDLDAFGEAILHAIDRFRGRRLRSILELGGTDGVRRPRSGVVLDAEATATAGGGSRPWVSLLWKFAAVAAWNPDSASIQRVRAILIKECLFGLSLGFV